MNKSEEEARVQADLSAPEEKKQELRSFRRTRIVRIWFVRFMAALLVSLFLFALILPLRPHRSESENRDLTPFPRFSFASLFSGEFFDGIAVWYADTFPLRDGFVSLNAYLSGAYGQNDVRIHGKVNVADDIPDDKKTASAPDQNTASETASVQEAPPEPTAQTIDDAILLYGDTAYEYYNFVRKYSDSYVATVNRAAGLLDGKATVYALIAPTSMGITAPEKITASIQTSDQKKAIDYMYGNLSDKVKKVSVFDTLKAHRNEYIYFRTDHHWTALGAYYAYTELMKAKGAQPLSLSAYTERSFPGYLGSFYNTSKKAPALAANPDTVFAYQPPSTNECRILFKSSRKWATAEIVSDMSSVSSKYLTFIKGDNPVTYIKNPARNDQSVCLLIKESFGNAFAPFPVENYQHVYVLDYRYFANFDQRGLSQYCTDIMGSSLDVVFLNNISATRNKSLMDSLSYFVR